MGGWRDSWREKQFMNISFYLLFILYYLIRLQSLNLKRKICEFACILLILEFSWFSNSSIYGVMSLLIKFYIFPGNILLCFLCKLTLCPYDSIFSVII